MNIIIHADATPQMGAGHVMRCIALALNAQSVGMSVLMVGYIQIPWVKKRLQNEGILFKHLEYPCVSEARFHHAAIENTWFVLDGYHFGTDHHKAIRSAGHKLLVIDDYNHLAEYNCDILLNQNLGAENFEYYGNIKQKCLGIEYALLRPEFFRARPAALARHFTQVPTKILLTLGGGDFSQFLATIALCFAVPEMKQTHLRIIAGTTPQNAIFDAFSMCPATIEILGCVDDMPALLLETDLCITAGGSTCWELSCLQVPFLTIATAENQKEIVRYLSLLYGVQPLTPQNLTTCLLSAPSTLPFVTGLGTEILLKKMQC